MYEDYLYHYGVKGMKWGVRKGPPYPAGSGRKAKRISNIQTKYGFNRKQAEEYYKAQQRALKIAGGVALAAGIGVATYFIAKNVSDGNLDFSIRPFQDVYRATNNKDEGIPFVFYGTADKVDSLRYKGTAFYNHLNQFYKTTDLFEKTFKPTSKIKVCGVKNSQKIFSDLLKTDSAFREKCKEMSYRNYDLFNTYAFTQQDRDMYPAKKFIEVLQSKGYGGLIDMNDKFGAYGTKKPIIFIGQNEQSLKIKSVLQVPIFDLLNNDDKVANYDYSKMMTEAFFKNPVNVAEIVTAPSVAAGTAYITYAFNQINNEGKK